MKVVLISTYELGHQPFGIASPAAWLRDAGATVDTLDLALERLDERKVARGATWSRSTCRCTPPRGSPPPPRRGCARSTPARRSASTASTRPVNEAHLREIGADAVIGGEFEEGLVALHAPARGRRARRAARAGDVARPPAVRDSRPRGPAAARARTRGSRCRTAPPRWWATRRRAAAASTSAATARSCRCTAGRFRVVRPRRRARRRRAARSRRAPSTSPSATPTSSTAPATRCRSCARCTTRFPELTYDVTIKVEHLLRHAALLPGAARHRLPVRHERGRGDRRRDARALRQAPHARRLPAGGAAFRELGLALSPTFVTFTPVDHARGLPRAARGRSRELDLVESVAPVQYAIRLLDAGGLAAARAARDRRGLVERSTARRSLYPWRHADPRVDELFERVHRVVGDGASRAATCSRRSARWRPRRAAASSPSPARRSAPRCRT